MTKRAWVAALTIGVGISLSPPIPQQCESEGYRRSNPAVCGSSVFPFPDFRGGGDQDDDGGLLGRIIHRLTGGLL